VHDDVELLGQCGTGTRNSRGRLLIQWVLQQGLAILNRQADENQKANSWTCRRVSDGALVQIDYVFASQRLMFQRAWCDNCIATGLDHR